ncbi:MAG: corrinoid protein [Dethiobacteraceae bacterium]|jgi:methanogenic corrinoid protein MtbC1|nr:cobalamin-binding protein [Bacillota bacterium]
MSKLAEIKANVEAGKTKVVPGLVQEALDAGFDAKEILAAMVDAMSVVGDKFSAGEIFVPEMLIAGKAMQKGVDVLSPVLAGDKSASLGKCIIGTVKGDLHDIGKNLVALMIGSTGFEMIDLGVDVSKETFVEAIKENPDTNIVALSALLSTTMPSMKETVAAIRESGLTGFKIIVGGAPITQEFADEIGADAYAPDAGGAAIKVKELVS